MKPFHAANRKIVRKSFIWITVALMLLLAGCSSADNANNVAQAESTEAGDSSKGDEHTSKDKTAPAVEEPAPEREQEGLRRYGTNNADVQAGQLTAGEWDDLAAWEPFNNLLNSQEGDYNLNHWRFQSFERLEVQVTANGKAVSDATVLLEGQQGTEWTARTNTDGIAYVFAGLFGGEQQLTKRHSEDSTRSDVFEVEVKKGQSSKKVSDIRIQEQGTLKVSLDEEEKPSDRLDVMFVVDTTGSMQDELDFLEAELKDVIGRVADEHANQLDIRMSANFYRDKHDDYVVKPNPFTGDIDEVIQQMASQKAKGGGDFPEAVEEALQDAIMEHKWSEEARARLLFLVLDAPPHHEGEIIDQLHDLIEEAASQGIRIIPVVSSGIDIQTEYLMRFMSVATGGTYLFLTDDSGIGGDHLEPAAGEYEVKLLNDLLVETINQYVD
ncbi:vWA domain-containing protein [Paenibacillus sp. NEAU-GSW1]|uniref:vWA domain-containing protein n=1 Tax=Paenibacillus sp. NEAU-GSW1 TaxID=2682486 RepID=UPI0012E20E07|nr:VWA domain-containing protein [Paenibacillus sp. NEAU-GSW1]